MIVVIMLMLLVFKNVYIYDVVFIKGKVFFYCFYYIKIALFKFLNYFFVLFGISFCYREVCIYEKVRGFVISSFYFV